MRAILIFFVPIQATQREFEAALREHPSYPQIDRDRINAVQLAPSDPDEQPMWTWFLPNPTR